MGIEPAENMRRRAEKLTENQSSVQILEGRFEGMPIASASIDYLYSILAFHWVTDLEASANEIARVLKPTAEMDLVFIGRDSGREFIQKTTPIFLKYMGPARLLASARLRKQLTREDVCRLFLGVFGTDRLSVEESYETYYDTLEGHMAWWVRIEGHFIQIPPEKRHECDQEIHEAISSLAGPLGIPYKIHLLRVRLRQPV
jgi:ubiquinone/menaquinone biosynthesis C-methylase UbiE